MNAAVAMNAGAGTDDGAPPAEILLRVADLRVEFGARAALSGVTFDPEIAAAALMSASTIVPSKIIAEVIVPVGICVPAIDPARSVKLG